MTLQANQVARPFTNQRKIMRIPLKVLFILVAIAAVISLWLAQRRTPLLPGALVQVVAPSQRTEQARSNSSFEDAFYSLLINRLTADHPELLIGMEQPEIRIRETIRLERTVTDDATTIYSVHAWGNVITSDRNSLKVMMKTALEVLNTMTADRSSPRRTKILNAPSL